LGAIVGERELREGHEGKAQEREFELVVEVFQLPEIVDDVEEIEEDSEFGEVGEVPGQPIEIGDDDPLGDEVVDENILCGV